MTKKKNNTRSILAVGETYEGRLFHVPSPECAYSDLPNMIQTLAESDPHTAIRRAALVCIRECQPTYVESRVKRIVHHLLGSMEDQEIGAIDIASAATFSYDAQEIADAFIALDKLRIAIEEDASPSRQLLDQLYSVTVLLTQSSPNMTSLSMLRRDTGTRTTDNLEIVCRVALCRASIIGDGVLNGFEVLKNLAIELHSDDGAIAQPKFYESLFTIFRDIVSEDYPWIEPDQRHRLSPKDFSSLILRAKRGGNVGSEVLRFIAETQPSQLMLDI